MVLLKIERMDLRACDHDYATENGSEEIWSENESDENACEVKQNAFWSVSGTWSETVCDAAREREKKSM